MSDDEENMDYEQDYINEDNLDDDNGNIAEGKYEFLTKDEMDKEREKKIEEFIQISDLPKSKAELVLMNNNWNIDILMNDWYDKMQKIKENSGISQTKKKKKELNKYFKSHKIPDNYCLVCETEIEPGDEKGDDTAAQQEQGVRADLGKRDDAICRGPESDGRRIFE